MVQALAAGLVVGLLIGAADRAAAQVPLQLTGTVFDSSTGQPLPDGDVRLTALPARDSGLRQSLDPSGGFRFTGLAAGRYLLDVRRLGYARRLDTIALAQAPGLDIRLTMQPVSYCLDVCPADSALVATVRAQADRWRCDRDPASLAAARAEWAAALADTVVAASMGLRSDSARIAPRLQPVTRDADCRRAAGGLPEPTVLEFTVFRLDGFWLISQPGFATPTVLDANLDSVLSFNGMFWSGRALPARRPLDWQ